MHFCLCTVRCVAQFEISDTQPVLRFYGFTVLRFCAEKYALVVIIRYRILRAVPTRTQGGWRSKDIAGSGGGAYAGA